MWHIAISVGIQFTLWLLTGSPWYGVAASLLFIGREHAQAEYRWIEHYGQHLRANMPWWGGFDPKVWNLKSLLDWTLPLGVTLAMTLFVVA